MKMENFSFMTLVLRLFLVQFLFVLILYQQRKNMMIGYIQVTTKSFIHNVISIKTSEIC